MCKILVNVIFLTHCLITNCTSFLFLNFGRSTGMTKICDPTERCDAFEGFILTVQANPDSIKNASENDITSILFAIVSWHIPDGNTADLLQGAYAFIPFPDTYSVLFQAIKVFLHNLKGMIGDDLWRNVEKSMPVNVRQLLRDQYHL